VLNSHLSSYALLNAGQGVVGYSSPIWRDQRPAAYRRDLQSVLALVADGSLRPLIGARFALKDAATAQRALESRSVSGKIVLLPE
jgi:NADPH2:quinone reductase